MSFAEEDLHVLSDRLRGIPGIVAVTLGGSRARGEERPDSDWDVGLYYRGSLDPGEIERLGYEGEIVAPGDWAYPMNGGAWLTIEGSSVDLVYRDLDDVERWIDASAGGEWELFRVPGFLAGMATYVVVGELALGRVVAGELPRPGFPNALGASAPERWRYESTFAMDQAGVHARRGDPTPCMGGLAVAVIAEAQARLASRGEWALNEKGIVERAGLAAAGETLARHRDDEPLTASVDRVRRALEDGPRPSLAG